MYEDFDDEYPEFEDDLDLQDEVGFEVPDDGLVLHVLDKSGKVDDIIIGLKQIKEYILKK